MHVQGCDSQCDSVDLLLSAPDNSQGSHCDQEFILPVLAPLHDECTEWPAVGWVQAGKHCLLDYWTLNSFVSLTTGR